MTNLSSELFRGLLSHEEAAKLEITQLGTSACGATALLNVLLALKVINKEQCTSLDWSMCTLRKRDYEASLPQYLASRSVAGCTGQDLVDSMYRLTAANKLAPLKGEFVSFESLGRSSNGFIDFLSTCIGEGKAVVATLNLQVVGNDAWHHQLVYGVSLVSADDNNNSSNSEGVYCLNPQCKYPADLFESFLSTESVLLIRREDVMERVNRPIAGNELSECEVYEDRERWKELQVKQQIDRMIAADSDNCSPFIVIPANYVPGFAVFSV